MTCTLCGKPITQENQKAAFRQVIGWRAPKRSKLHEARETGAFAHQDCILKLKLGFAIEQEALFE